MHAGIAGDRVDGVGGAESGGGVVVGVGVSGVGADAGAPEADSAREGLLSWLAGPYGLEPVNGNGIPPAAEVQAITEQWNRVLFLRFALAGGLLGVRSGGVCGPAPVGVK